MITKIKVSNMTSNNGNKIANQFEIRTDKGVYFQSYNSIIAFVPYADKPTILDSYYWDYSRTTGKYRNAFLGETIAETRQKIADKVYQLKDLQIKRSPYI
tara:strand:- start:7 stop:306 length:300 start_codon:yes stop_codon:yes gene_type:complete